MDNPLSVLSITIGGFTTAAVAYIGGVFSKPLQDYITFLRRRGQIRLCLYSEVGRLYSQYEHLAYHSNLSIKVHSTNEAYTFAMQTPEIYYSLKDKLFFDSLYRTFLNFDGRRKTPMVAKTFIAAIDEQILLGQVDRKFLRKHCDENGRKHIDAFPERIFKSVEELESFLEKFDTKAA